MAAALGKLGSLGPGDYGCLAGLLTLLAKAVTSSTVHPFSYASATVLCFSLVAAICS